MLSKQRANVLTSKISRNDFPLSYMGFLFFFSRVVKKKNTFKNYCTNISIYFLSFKKAAKEILSILSSYAKGSDKTERLSVHTIICIYHSVIVFQQILVVISRFPPTNKHPKMLTSKTPEPGGMLAYMAEGELKLLVSRSYNMGDPGSSRCNQNSP